MSKLEGGVEIRVESLRRGYMYMFADVARLA